MTKYTRTDTLLAMMLIVIVGCNTSSAKAYRTYVIRPAISSNAILDDEALPATCRDESIMKVLCARGEYEPASFLVETDKPLVQVMVRVEPLTGSAGMLPPETVDVRIARKIYRAAGCWSHETLPWVLVHDPGLWQIIDQTPKWVLDMPGESYAGLPIAEYRAGISKVNQLARPLIDTNLDSHTAGAANDSGESGAYSSGTARVVVRTTLYL